MGVGGGRNPTSLASQKSKRARSDKSSHCQSQTLSYDVWFLFSCRQGNRFVNRNLIPRVTVTSRPITKHEAHATVSLHALAKSNGRDTMRRRARFIIVFQ